ncbi:MULTISPECIES: hypothetical protein [Symbiopectobacterium]|uniref:hypothetical protein n=1 Tax=Symbiopectobacterium TaxID=801 RepID=UPI001A3474B0|nr:MULTISPECIES: hypothetical protein [Symbiopectobacterium]MBG6248468.1 hypothetical protein [Candidatus Symbiopectobacterium sp. PLON1]MBT9428851.1 hypothetical protein [Candidatus Symbiopectobacterium endolongispinus]
MSIIETLATRTALTSSASRLVASQGNAFDIELKKAVAKEHPAQQENSVSAQPELVSHQSTAAQELQEWLEMSPEDRLFFTVLASMGISKEEFEAMPPEEQSRVTHKVQESIKERAKEGLQTQIA